jgi:sRNA-binding carbon storage regulator CsrA
MSERGRLVLGLKQGESVYIDGGIVLTINKAGSRVEIALEAPKSTQIWRAESQVGKTINFNRGLKE